MPVRNLAGEVVLVCLQKTIDPLLFMCESDDGSILKTLFTHAHIRWTLWSDGTKTPQVARPNRPNGVCSTKDICIAPEGFARMRFLWYLAPYNQCIALLVTSYKQDAKTKRERRAMGVPGWNTLTIRCLVKIWSEDSSEESWSTCSGAVRLRKISKNWNPTIDTTARVLRCPYFWFREK